MTKAKEHRATFIIYPCLFEHSLKKKKNDEEIYIHLFFSLLEK